MLNLVLHFLANQCGSLTKSMHNEMLQYTDSNTLNRIRFSANILHLSSLDKLAHCV